MRRPDAAGAHGLTGAVDGWVGLEVFSQMAAVVEALLANGAAIASRCFVLLVGMFSDVMALELASSVKVSVAHST